MENDTKRTIKVRQGTGEDALEMTVQVTQEEFDKMEQIRRFSPESWEGKDLELIQEARKVIKEKEAETINPEQEVNEKQKLEQDIDETPIKTKEKQNKNNPGLWWTLGVLGVLLVAYLIFNSILQNRVREAREVIVNYALNNKNVNYQGVSFDYPANWSFKNSNSANNMYQISGLDEKGDEFVVILAKNIPNIEREFIDEIIVEYMNTEGTEDMEYSAIYETTFHGIKSAATDFSYKLQGERAVARTIGFTLNNSTFVIIKSAKTKDELEGDNFKIMESTFKYAKQ